VTTSSHKKGILPVRLGLEPDNKTALKELGMDPALDDQMNDQQLDELIIENEYNEALDWYRSQGNEEQGLKNMGKWKRAALKQAKEN
tara:strand:- start:2320 stop:2580 length:261 start_codon:yes stop_codon:yes gene_type:complete